MSKEPRNLAADASHAVATARRASPADDPPSGWIGRSIATVALSGTLEEKLAAIARAGFDGVEIFENDLISCPLTPEEIRRRAHDLGLEIFLYQPLRDLEAVSADRLRANLRRAEAKFALMERLGTKTVLACSNVREDAIDDDALAAEQLSRLADRAREHGIRVAYEALAWGRHVDRFEHSWRIVALADHPNLGIGLDSFHILSVGDGVAGVRTIPGECIAFVQLADAPRLQMDVLQWSRHFRCFPGQGRLELVDFMQAVLATSYSGPFSLEIFNDVFRQADPDRIAVDGMRSMIALEERLARAAASRGADRPDRASAARPPAELRDRRPALPPRASSLHGYAFVEVGLDAVWEHAFARLLRALGFRREGLHRSKDVSLWRAGETIVLVNTEPLPLRHQPWPILSAVALESEDPGRSAERALALLAMPVPRHRGPAEAALRAVAAPDGTSVFFCRTRTDAPNNWRDDFDAIETAHEERPFELGPIDHVALAQPLEHFEEAVLFYEAITGLEPQPGEELTTPHGLLRSRAMSNASETVRLVLNAPLLGRDRPTSPSAQHVAFLVSDVIAAARWTSANGLDILPVPRNYYDDLRARYEIPDRVLDELQACNTLYDRDERGGEFLHFYSRAVGQALFFEFVERRGGYAGYGSVNGPVRASVQARLDAHPVGGRPLAGSQELVAGLG